MVVGVVKASSHYDAAYKSLQVVKNAVTDKLRGKKTILIKPNFVSTSRPLAATHVDSVKAFIDFVYENLGSVKILVAEASLGSLSSALRNFGYLKLKDLYGVDFLDLNEDQDYIEYEVYGSSSNRFSLFAKSIFSRVKRTGSKKSLENYVTVRVSRTAAKAAREERLVSICRAKTHDTVIVTLSIKNVAVGIIKREDKWRIHQGYGAINMTLAKIALDFSPAVSVIDGYEAMEGNGPVNGLPVKWGVGLAGIDPLEVDTLAAWMMGFNPSDIGYIYLLWRHRGLYPDPAAIKVVGEDPAMLRRNFKPHSSYRSQLRWREELGL